MRVCDECGQELSWSPPDRGIPGAWRHPDGTMVRENANGGFEHMFLTVSELSEGRSVYLSPTSTTHSIVIEIREPRHGAAAAHGYQAVVVDTWLEGLRRYQRATRLAGPRDSFRLAECLTGEHRWNDAPDDALSGRCRVCGVAEPRLAG